MRQPYTYRTRSKLAPRIWAMKVGDVELFAGFAEGSVKSVVCRWRQTNKTMQFRTKKTSAGTIVFRLPDKRRPYIKRRKPNDTTVTI